MRTRLFRQWNGPDIDMRAFYDGHERRFFYTIERKNGVIGIRGCTRDFDVVAVRKSDFTKYGEDQIRGFLGRYLTLNDRDLEYMMKFIKKDLGISEK